MILLTKPVGNFFYRCFFHWTVHGENANLQLYTCNILIRLIKVKITFATFFLLIHLKPMNSETLFETFCKRMLHPKYLNKIIKFIIIVMVLISWKGTNVCLYWKLVCITCSLFYWFLWCRKSRIFCPKGKKYNLYPFSGN